MSPIMVLILLDYFLQDQTGLAFVRAMEEGGLETPVVVISGKGDEMIAVQLIQAGAYDYLIKNRVNKESFSRVIMNTLERARLKKEVIEAQRRMAEMSTRDELTKLYNRRYFNEAMEREVSRAKRYATDLTLCMLDLDHFKRVNDEYGHATRDIMLSEIAKMLINSVRQRDVCCRYGGEERACLRRV